MPPYAYPIKINREKQVIRFHEHKGIESNSLTLEDLQFVGQDKFSICEKEVETGIGCYPEGYIITVYRSRLETDEEYNKRIASEEAYMAEYNKRHPKTV